MRRVQLSVIGLMAVVGLAALDLSVFRALPSVQTLSERLCVIALLPVVNLLAVCLAMAIGSLVQRGEVRLSLLVFLLVGGAMSFGVLAVTVLSQGTFYEYFETTAGSIQELLLTSAQKKAIAAGNMGRPMYSPGFGAILAFLVLTPLHLLPALLAGWAARGYRLRLERTRETTEPPGPAIPQGSTPSV